MIPTLKNNLLIFWHFFKRDWYAQRKHIKNLLINYCVFYPCLNSFAFAYVQAHIYFGANATRASELFIGSILITVMLLTYKLTIDLLFDLQGNRFIDYQITLLSPRIILMERIFFTSVFSFMLAAPFYPISKLLLRSHFDTSNISWLKAAYMLYLGTLCFAAYHQCASVIMKENHQIKSLWSRINHPMLMFGGLWIPFYVVKEYSTLLGTIMMASPAVYLSDGLRQAIVGGPHFLPLWHCALALITLTVFFTAMCFYFFKKRTDHI